MTIEALPRTAGLTAEFSAWLGAGELRIQRCNSCGHPRHVPRHLCPRCGSADAEWMPCTGRGRLYSWTTTYRPLHPAFTATPFTIAVVALDEGPRIVASLLGIDPHDLRADLTVRLDTQATAETSVPAFRPDPDADPLDQKGKP